MATKITVSSTSLATIYKKKRLTYPVMFFMLFENQLPWFANSEMCPDESISVFSGEIRDLCQMSKKLNLLGVKTPYVTQLMCGMVVALQFSAF